MSCGPHVRHNLWERRKLPQRGPGRSPRRSYLVHFGASKINFCPQPTTLMTDFGQVGLKSQHVANQSRLRSAPWPPLSFTTACGSRLAVMLSVMAFKIQAKQYVKQVLPNSNKINSSILRKTRVSLDYGPIKTGPLPVSVTLFNCAMLGPVFSKRERSRSLYAIARPSVVCLLSVCL